MTTAQQEISMTAGAPRDASVPPADGVVALAVFSIRRAAARTQ